ncbi:MAG: DUF6263 family protein [Chitinophagaceae bacterium]
MMQVKKIAGFALVLMMAITARAQELIALNLARNGTYTHSSASKVSIRQTVSGQQTDVSMNVSSTINFTVTGIRDTLYLMEARYTRLAVDMKLPDGNVSYSSDKDNDPMSNLLAMIINKPFDIRMTKKGRITASSGVESLIAGIADSLAGVSDAQKQQLRDQVTKAYGDQALKGSIEMVTALFPDTRVAPGNKWSVRSRLESGLPAAVETIYELKAVTDSSYRIAGSSLIRTENKDEYMPLDKMFVKYDLTGTMLTDIEIDKKTGWIISCAGKQQIAGTAEMKTDAGPSATGMIITMIIKNELTTTR